ncbi:MAG: cell wall-binding repeat-containing protein [Coriobacteriia bacterium]
MGKSLRAAFVLLVACGLLLGMMPTGAFGAVAVTWADDDLGTAGTGTGQFTIPTGVAVDKWGNVYACAAGNADSRVQVFQPDGTVGVYSNPGTGDGQLIEPFSLAVDRWGSVYVADKSPLNQRIVVLNKLLYGGYHQRMIGGLPADPIPQIAGIAVGLDGFVYAALESGQVQRREASGDFADSWAYEGCRGVNVSQDGRVYVSISSYTVNPADGDQLAFRDPLPGGWSGWSFGYPGDDVVLTNPWGIASDGGDRAFVLDYDSPTLGHVLDPDSGDELATFGGLGVTSGLFNSPRQMAAGYDRTLYVADSYNDRISKWNVSTPTAYVPVQGTNRYTTAIDASVKAYPNGARTVVLATGENWPDALGGAALAGAAQGPLLLTPSNVLLPEVAAEIWRLGAEHVYILGGSAAISDDVWDDAMDAMMPAQKSGARLGGATRYETANKIAEEVVWIENARGGYDGTAFVCTGVDFPDALAAAPIAAANGWPIYLTQAASLTPSTKTAMVANSATHGYIVGGTGAVAAAVETELDATFIDFTRYGGSNRYDTAAKLADEAFEGMGMLWSRPALATGLDFPDALAGGVLQGSDYSVLLLTRGTTLSPEAATALTNHKDMIYELRYLGGEGVLTPTVRTAAQALLW